MNKLLKYGLWLLGGLALVALIWLVSEILLSGYGPGTIDKLNNPSIENCESIPSDDYGIFLFNPSDARISYHRSSCYLRLAAHRSSNENLCEKVKEKKSFFFDGSAISPQECLRVIETTKSLEEQASY